MRNFNYCIRCHTMHVFLKCPAYLLACVSILGRWQKYMLVLLFLQRWKPCLLVHLNQSCSEEKILKIPILKQCFHCSKEQTTKKA